VLLLYSGNPKENGFQKLVHKFKRNPMVTSKVMAILTRYSSLADDTSSSPSCDSIATPRKRGFGKSWKNMSAIHGRIESYSHFDSLLKCGRPDLLVPSCDSIATPRKMASRKSCKNLSAIQRSDRKFWPFWPVTQVWPTRHPRHRVGIPYQP
jgi:hypothetical protein